MVYAFPATSASSERLFSQAGNVIYDKRTLLNSTRVEELIYIHENYAKAEPMIRKWKFSLADFERHQFSTERLNQLSARPESNKDVDLEPQEIEESEYTDMDVVSEISSIDSGKRLSSKSPSPESSPALSPVCSSPLMHTDATRELQSSGTKSQKRKLESPHGSSKIKVKFPDVFAKFRDRFKAREVKASLSDKPVETEEVLYGTASDETASVISDDEEDPTSI